MARFTHALCIMQDHILSLRSGLVAAGFYPVLLAAMRVPQFELSLSGCR